MSSFLYGQTEYNILSSSVKLDDYIKLAKLYGYDSLSITDSNMYGAYKFYKLCKKNDIKPIIGIEISIESSDEFENKFICYALDSNGYEGLLRLSSIAKTTGKAFSLSELRVFTGIIFISTQHSDLFRICKNSDFDMFKNRFEAYKESFYEFGIGISMSTRDDLQVASTYKEYSNMLSFNLYPLAQTLYSLPSDTDVYEAICLISNKEPIIDGKYNIPDKLELEERFFMYEECFSNLDKLISEINFEIKPVSISLPKYPKTEGYSSDKFLMMLCEKGLNKRLAKEAYASFEDYKKRLDYELSVIHKMNYDDYFLIVWDYVKYAKKIGIMVGPGRGSAAGSLVSYCLGITTVDPLRYNLLFERFLNPERVSMPDIDVDFPSDKRQLVFDYVKELYGKDRVCTILSYQTFQRKSSLRSLGKALHVDLKKIDILTKVVDTTDDFDSLLEQYKNNADILKLLTISKKLENCPSNLTTHASGIILSNEPLTKNVAVQNGLYDLYQAQMDEYDLEELGLLKMDFLSVSDLTLLDEIAKEVPNMNNITISNIPLDDSNTFKLLQKGDTYGVFQLEKEAMRKTLIKFRVEKFEDIVAILALYRPGPIKNIDEYIERKNGKKFEYLHKDLEPILKDTYGIIVYQEQIMQIANKFAGFSLGQADILRKAVSKKNKDTLLEYRKEFVKRSTEKGYSDKVSNEIYDYIVEFASYGFNKNHSVAYSVLAYYMAYFKANYYTLFMSKLMNRELGNYKKMAFFDASLKSHNVRISKPSINKSGLEFYYDNGQIIYPLPNILSITKNVAKNIIDNRNEFGPYKSFSDFKMRNPEISIEVLEALIYSGSFDEFNHTKKSLIESSSKMVDIYKQFISASEVITREELEFDYDFLKQNEKKFLGFNIEYDDFKNIEILKKNYNACSFARKYEEKFINVLAKLTDLKEVKTVNGNFMLLGNAYDGTSNVKIVLFPKKYMELKNKIELDQLCLIHGKLVKNQSLNKYEFQIFDIIKRI